MLISLLFAAAAAASPPVGGVLPNEQTTYDALLAAQARAADDMFSGSPCAASKVEVISVAPWKIAGRPELIVWRERVRVTGCGHSSVENANVGRLGGDPPWRISTGLPGESLSDMPLQQTTFPAAVAEARAGLSADCKAQRLHDVYVAARPGDVDISSPGVPPSQHRNGHPSVTLPETATPMLDKLSFSGAWMEVWPFEVCGHDRTLGVVFIPLKDQSASAHVFLPIWREIEAHGPGARPAPVSVEN